VGLPWLCGEPVAGSFGPGLFTRPVDQVARRLLGARLVSTVGGVRTAGVIVETEAYGGADDPASHAATRAGRTRRNATMFGPPGHAYVYRSYGMHWCVNVVTGVEGDPQAVLLRGLEPLEGEEAMTRRRRRHLPLATGPGRLCEALGIDGSLDGHDLCAPPLVLEPGWTVPAAMVGVSGRVGVRLAAERPLRFVVVGSPGAPPLLCRMENG
jgi:DNA-3-methyladenine glycosylase